MTYVTTYTIGCPFPLVNDNLDPDLFNVDRDLDWWEEVDLVYPLYPEMAEHREKSSSEPDPVRESELLEREGEAPSAPGDQEAPGREPGQE